MGAALGPGGEHVDVLVVDFFAHAEGLERLQDRERGKVPLDRDVEAAVIERGSMPVQG
jgi:hypothetical protein